MSSLLFYLFILFYVHWCLVCMYVYMQRSDLGATVSCELPCWMLGIEPRSSVRKANALNCWVISPVPSMSSISPGSQAHWPVSKTPDPQCLLVFLLPYEFLSKSITPLLNRAYRFIVMTVSLPHNPGPLLYFFPSVLKSVPSHPIQVVPFHVPYTVS